MRMAEEIHALLPRPETHAKYMEIYRCYDQVYRAVRPLGCVSKRKNCKFEWIWCQFKDGNRRFSGAKSRFSDAEVGSLQGFRVCLIAGRLLTAQSKIETQHLNGAKDAEIAV